MNRKRTAIILILVTLVVSGLFATRLWAAPNPVDELPLPLVQHS